AMRGRVSLGGWDRRPWFFPGAATTRSLLAARATWAWRSPRSRPRGAFCTSLAAAPGHDGAPAGDDTAEHVLKSPHIKRDTKERPRSESNSPSSRRRRYAPRNPGARSLPPPLRED